MAKHTNKRQTRKQPDPFSAHYKENNYSELAKRFPTFKVYNAKTCFNLRLEALSKEANNIVNTLHAAGHDVYYVGGVIRDLLIGLKFNDIDICSTAQPEEVKQVFNRRCKVIGRRFVLCHVSAGSEKYDVASLREDRHSQNVTNQDDIQAMNQGILLVDNNYSRDIAEDALRRDFTINALYGSVVHNHIIDFFNGVQDLLHHRIVMIGDPNIRLREDPMRIIRAIRQSAKLNFDIDPELRQAIFRHKSLLKLTSQYRLSDELNKTLSCGAALKTIEQFIEYDLSDICLPQFTSIIEQEMVSNEDFVYVPAFKPEFAHKITQLSQKWSVELESQGVNPHLIQHHSRSLALTLAGAIITDARVADNQPVNPAFMLTTMRAIGFIEAYMLLLNSKSAELNDVDFRDQVIHLAENTFSSDSSALNGRDKENAHTILINLAYLMTIAAEDHDRVRMQQPMFRAAFSVFKIYTQLFQVDQETLDHFSSWDKLHTRYLKERAQREKHQSQFTSNDYPARVTHNIDISDQQLQDLVAPVLVNIEHALLMHNQLAHQGREVTALSLFDQLRQEHYQSYTPIASAPKKDLTREVVSHAQSTRAVHDFYSVLQQLQAELSLATVTSKTTLSAPFTQATSNIAFPTSLATSIANVNNFGNYATSPFAHRMVPNLLALELMQAYDQYLTPAPTAVKYQQLATDLSPSEYRKVIHQHLVQDFELTLEELVRANIVRLSQDQLFIEHLQPSDEAYVPTILSYLDTLDQRLKQRQQALVDFCTAHGWQITAQPFSLPAINLTVTTDTTSNSGSSHTVQNAATTNTSTSTNHTSSTNQQQQQKTRILGLTPEQRIVQLAEHFGEKAFAEYYEALPAIWQQQLLANPCKVPVPLDSNYATGATFIENYHSLFEYLLEYLDSDQTPVATPVPDAQVYAQAFSLLLQLTQARNSEHANQAIQALQLSPAQQAYAQAEATRLLRVRDRFLAFRDRILAYITLYDDQHDNGSNYQIFAKFVTDRLPYALQAQFVCVVYDLLFRPESHVTQIQLSSAYNIVLDTIVHIADQYQQETDCAFQYALVRDHNTTHTLQREQAPAEQLSVIDWIELQALSNFYPHQQLEHPGVLSALMQLLMDQYLLQVTSNIAEQDPDQVPPVTSLASNHSHSNSIATTSNINAQTSQDAKSHAVITANEVDTDSNSDVAITPDTTKELPVVSARNRAAHKVRQVLTVNPVTPANTATNTNLMPTATANDLAKLRARSHTASMPYQQQLRAVFTGNELLPLALDPQIATHYVDFSKNVDNPTWSNWSNLWLAQYHYVSNAYEHFTQLVLPLWTILNLNKIDLSIIKLALQAAPDLANSVTHQLTTQTPEHELLFAYNQANIMQPLPELAVNVIEKQELTNIYTQQEISAITAIQQHLATVMHQGTSLSRKPIKPTTSLHPSTLPEANKGTIDPPKVTTPHLVTATRVVTTNQELEGLQNVQDVQDMADVAVQDVDASKLITYQVTKHSLIPEITSFYQPLSLAHVQRLEKKLQQLEHEYQQQQVTPLVTSIADLTPAQALAFHLQDQATLAKLLPSKSQTNTVTNQALVTSDKETSKTPMGSTTSKNTSVAPHGKTVNPQQLAKIKSSLQTLAEDSNSQVSLERDSNVIKLEPEVDLTPFTPETADRNTVAQTFQQLDKVLQTSYHQGHNPETDLAQLTSNISNQPSTARVTNITASELTVSNATSTHQTLRDVPVSQSHTNTTTTLASNQILNFSEQHHLPTQAYPQALTVYYDAVPFEIANLAQLQQQADEQHQLLDATKDQQIKATILIRQKGAYHSIAVTPRTLPVELPPTTSYNLSQVQLLTSHSQNLLTGVQKKCADLQTQITQVLQQLETIDEQNFDSKQHEQALTKALRKGYIPLDTELEHEYALYYLQQVKTSQLLITAQTEVIKARLSHLDFKLAFEQLRKDESQVLAQLAQAVTNQDNVTYQQARASLVQILRYKDYINSKIRQAGQVLTQCQNYANTYQAQQTKYHGFKTVQQQDYFLQLTPQVSTHFKQLLSHFTLDDLQKLEHATPKTQYQQYLEILNAKVDIEPASQALTNPAMLSLAPQTPISLSEFTNSSDNNLVLTIPSPVAPNSNQELRAIPLAQNLKETMISNTTDPLTPVTDVTTLTTTNTSTTVNPTPSDTRASTPSTSTNKATATTRVVTAAPANSCHNGLAKIEVSETKAMQQRREVDAMVLKCKSALEHGQVLISQHQTSIARLNLVLQALTTTELYFATHELDILADLAQQYAALTQAQIELYNSSIAHQLVVQQVTSAKLVLAQPKATRAALLLALSQETANGASADSAQVQQLQAELEQTTLEIATCEKAVASQVALKNQESKQLEKMRQQIKVCKQQVQAQVAVILENFKARGVKISEPDLEMEAICCIPDAEKYSDPANVQQISSYALTHQQQLLHNKFINFLINIAPALAPHATMTLNQAKKEAAKRRHTNEAKLASHPQFQESSLANTTPQSKPSALELATTPVASPALTTANIAQAQSASITVDAADVSTPMSIANTVTTPAQVQASTVTVEADPTNPMLNNSDYVVNSLAATDLALDEVSLEPTEPSVATKVQEIAAMHQLDAMDSADQATACQVIRKLEAPVPYIATTSDVNYIDDIVQLDLFPKLDPQIRQALSKLQRKQLKQQQRDLAKQTIVTLKQQLLDLPFYTPRAQAIIQFITEFESQTQQHKQDKKLKQKQKQLKKKQDVQAKSQVIARDAGAEQLGADTATDTALLTQVVNAPVVSENTGVTPEKLSKTAILANLDLQEAKAKAKKAKQQARKARKAQLKQQEMAAAAQLATATSQQPTLNERSLAGEQVVLGNHKRQFTSFDNTDGNNSANNFSWNGNNISMDDLPTSRKTPDTDAPVVMATDTASQQDKDKRIEQMGDLNLTIDRPSKFYPNRNQSSNNSNSNGSGNNQVAGNHDKASSSSNQPTGRATHGDNTNANHGGRNAHARIAVTTSEANTSTPNKPSRRTKAKTKQQATTYAADAKANTVANIANTSAKPKRKRKPATNANATTATTPVAKATTPANNATKDNKKPTTKASKRKGNDNPRNPKATHARKTNSQRQPTNTNKVAPTRNAPIVTPATTPAENVKKLGESVFKGTKNAFKKIFSFGKK